MPLISLGHVFKPDVTKLVHMGRCHNPGMQHLARAVYIMINALYPHSYYALISTPALYNPACLFITPLHMHTQNTQKCSINKCNYSEYSTWHLYIDSTLYCGFSA